MSINCFEWKVKYFWVRSQLDTAVTDLSTAPPHLVPHQKLSPLYFIRLNNFLTAHPTKTQRVGHDAEQRSKCVFKVFGRF